MTVEQMCCTPDQAKRLKELGVDQRSYFYHAIEGHILHLEYLPVTLKDRIDIIGSAFTVGELGEMLPEWINKDKTNYRRYQWTNCPEDNFLTSAYEVRTEYRNVYDENDTIPNDTMIESDTEAKARAALLIIILEDRLITPEEVNVQLDS